MASLTPDYACWRKPPDSVSITEALLCNQWEVNDITERTSFCSIILDPIRTFQQVWNKFCSPKNYFSKILHFAFNRETFVWNLQILSSIQIFLSQFLLTTCALHFYIFGIKTISVSRIIEGEKNENRGVLSAKNPISHVQTLEGCNLNMS